MPFYTFRCRQCEYRTEVFNRRREDVVTPVCGECEVEMGRDFRADRPMVNRDSYHKAIHSDALAITPGQVAEHKKLFPDIQIDSECRPVFDNYRQHDKYLDQIGAVKHPKRNKRRATKVIR